MEPKVYVSHSSNFDFTSELYQPLKLSNLVNKFDFILPHDGQPYQSGAKDLIKTCAKVVAEISFPSTGSGIEIGWADAFEIPLIILHNNNVTPSRYYYDLAENVLSYGSVEEMITKLADVLSQSENYKLNVT